MYLGWRRPFSIAPIDDPTLLRVQSQPAILRDAAVRNEGLDLFPRVDAPLRVDDFHPTNLA